MRKSESRTKIRRAGPNLSAYALPMPRIFIFFGDFDVIVVGRRRAAERGRAAAGFARLAPASGAGSTSSSASCAATGTVSSHLSNKQRV